MNWIKKIKIFFTLLPDYIGNVLYSGNKVIFEDTNNTEGPTISAEQSKTQKSVYQDLINQNVTQEVKELRHEMYFSERESYKYEYAGGGLAIKKNRLFDYSGDYEKSDGLSLYILQPNILDHGRLQVEEYMINNESVCDEIVSDALKTGREYEYTIKIKRPFIPRFKLEQYSTKLIVKKINNNEVILDFYVSKYEAQFNKIQRIFLNEIKSIKEGKIRSDLIDFDEVSFISYNAYGTDALKQYVFVNPSFITITEFDGSYVVKFQADIKVDGFDLIAEYYDEVTAEKCRNHELRDNAVFDATSKFGTEEINSEVIEMIGDYKMK